MSKRGDLACCHLSALGAAQVKVVGEHERKAAMAAGTVLAHGTPGSPGLREGKGVNELCPEE